MDKRFINNYRGEQFRFTPRKIKIKDEPLSPTDTDFENFECTNNSFENYDGSMKKSLSMNDLNLLNDDLMRLGFRKETNDAEYYQRRTGIQQQEVSKTKFVSIAEEIYHFQRDTPERFHSKPKIFSSLNSLKPSGLTVPQSPMLRCRGRSRPMHILSQKEKEELELEEMKNFKLKANPVPKCVIDGPNLPEVPKKPITIPAPFNLTEMPKKPPPQEDIPHFKARPAPKHILEKPQVPVKPPVHATQPVSPKFHYRQSKSFEKQCEIKMNLQNKTKLKSEEKEKPIRQGPIQPKPFSFEKRDQELKKKKEEKIKQQIEEERKQASLFKAAPLSMAVKKQMLGVASKSSSSTTSENKENSFKFEARPPSVLYKEPFKPVLQPIQPLRALPFQLSTQDRAVKREIFDKLLKEKDEEEEKLRLIREKELQESEAKARVELRTKLIHHSKPAPNADAFVPERSSAPLTVPETPKCMRRHRKQ